MSNYKRRTDMQRLYGRSDYPGGAILSSQLCGRRTRQNGEPCKQKALLGSTVCRFHGGKAPQVMKAAQERMAAMIDPLITELYRIATSGESEAVRVTAARDLLDRAGLKPKERVETISLQQFTLKISRGDDDGEDG